MRLVLFIAAMVFVSFVSFNAVGNFGENLPFYVQTFLGIILTLGIAMVIWNQAENPPALPFAPSPLGDRGHNVYTVANEKARKILGKFVEMAGYRLQGTFCAGPTDQRLYGADLVLMLFGPAPEADPNYNAEALPFIARSLVVSDPKMAAWKLCNQLEDAGFKTNIHRPLPDHQDKFFMVTSEAFIGGWGIAFRPWGPKMGKPESWQLGQ